MSLELKKAVANTTGRTGSDAVASTVSTVIADIRDRGDAAVREYSARFDKWSPAEFRLSAEEIERIIATVPAQTIEDIKTVQANVRRFAEKQLASMLEFEVETAPKFLRTVTYQEVTDATSSAELGELCGRAARAEFFEGHARSGDIRASRVRGELPAWAE